MTTQELAAQLKQKYPTYASIDDATLVQKTLEKYPVYRSQISDIPQVNQKPTFAQATAETTADLKQVGTDIKESLAERNAKIEANKAAQASGEQGGLRTGLQNLGQVLGFGADAIGDVFKGGVKALLPQKNEDAVKQNLATLYDNPVVKPLIDKIPVEELTQKFNQWKADNPAQARDLDAVGGFLAFASNFVGAEGAGAGAKAATTAVKDVAVNVGEKAATLANDAAGAIVKSSDELGNTVGTVVGDALEKTGQKIQNVVIKPSQRDMKDGFKIENVTKYDVGGSLTETVAKSHTKMNALVQELTAKLKGSTNKVDLNKTLEKTMKSLGGDKAMSFGDNSAITRVLKNLRSEIKQVSKTGKVDLVRGTNIKRGAGAKGAWAYNRPEVDASAIEKVYTEFYRHLKQDIEMAAPEGLQDINKQISELIPINNAALRRMTVEERNNALSLMDNIGLVSAVFDPRALLLYGANKAMKSGRVGNFLAKTGKNLKTRSISPTELPK